MKWTTTRTAGRTGEGSRPDRRHVSFDSGEKRAVPLGLLRGVRWSGDGSATQGWAQRPKDLTDLPYRPERTGPTTQSFLDPRPWPEQGPVWSGRKVTVPRPSDGG